MATSAFSPRIGIYGSDETKSAPSRGCYLWPLGYGPAVSEAGGTPVSLALPRPRALCEKILEELDGLLLVAREADGSWQSADADGWFALGVQWHPAAASASGLDIQLFRGLIEACRQQSVGSVSTACLQAA